MANVVKSGRMLMRLLRDHGTPQETLDFLDGLARKGPPPENYPAGYVYCIERVLFPRDRHGDICDDVPVAEVLEAMEAAMNPKPIEDGHVPHPTFSEGTMRKAREIVRTGTYEPPKYQQEVDLPVREFPDDDEVVPVAKAKAPLPPKKLPVE